MVAQHSHSQALGVYDMHLAGFMLGVNASRVRGWVKGKTSAGATLLPSRERDYDEVNLPELVELFLVKACIQEGMKLADLRQICTRLRSNSSGFPLTEKQPFGVHGGSLIDPKTMVDQKTGQRLLAFTKSLLKHVKLRDNIPTQFYPYEDKEIVLDVEILGGQPTLTGHRISTKALQGLYAANGERADLVAGWYGLKSTQVQSAVRFERDWQGLTVA